MYTATTQHSESLRRLPLSIWSSRTYYEPFRPALNLEVLSTLLRNASRHTSESRGKGKKRAASESPSAISSHHKRSKVSASSSGFALWSSENASESNVPEDAGLSVQVQPQIHYPYVSHQGDDYEGDHVYRHVFEIKYTTDVPSQAEHFLKDEEANRKQWAAQEQSFVDLLEELFGDLSEEKTVDMGKVSFGTYQDRIVACSLNRWLMLVPSIHVNIDKEADDYSSGCVNDMLVACSILKGEGRADFDGNLRLIAHPASSRDESMGNLPFRLQLEVKVSLVAPSIFQPIQWAGMTKRRITAIEDAQRLVLTHIFPDSNSVDDSTYPGETNIPFFYSILGPAPQMKSTIMEDAVQPKSLRPKLLPFQRRSVAWLLEREAKAVTSSGKVIAQPDSPTLFSIFWDRIDRGDNPPWYFHRLTGTLSLELPSQAIAPGGILAEEPGLGKTLECISLILLNPAPSRNPSVCQWDEEARIQVKEIKTTLIVTPPSLASQWADEIALHAPTLKVLVYDGWSKVTVPITEADAEKKRTELRSIKASKAATKGGSTAKVQKGKARTRAKAKNVETSPEEVLDWCNYINTFDVCITTYNVLKSDFNVARAPPVRPRREDVSYSNLERPRSPLIMCEWYRVIMDEVQMVGGGNTEMMVSLIPRVSSFAVSGTPARTSVDDLIHLLKFLRVDNLIGPARLWSRLQQPGFASYFASFFNQFAIRTMKSTVKNELTIPQQTRYLIGIELGGVERHVYDQNLETALTDLGLDARGVAAYEGFQVDSALLRSVLRKLRGICTHPQVGQLLKSGDKLYKPGTLKSMADVLEAMKDQNWRNFMDERKSKIQSLIRCAQLQQHDDNDPNRYQHSLETLILAENDAVRLIDDIKAAMVDHEAKGAKLKEEAAALREERQDGSDLDRRSEERSDADEPDLLRKGKGKAVERTTSPIASVGMDSEDLDLPRTAAGEEHGVKRRAFQQRLRECYVTMHRVKFLQGDVHHVLGESHIIQEDEAYASAEEIRRNLLRTTEESATRSMALLTRAAASKGIKESSFQIPVPYCDEGGIRSAHLMDEANEIIDELLNMQSALLWEWRSKIQSLLTQKLSSKDDEADGQEYARTLDTQGEAEAYLQAYSALLADRREVLVAERTLLAAHDVREKRLRHTKAAMRAAAAASAPKDGVEISEVIELQPEHEVLHKGLSETRKGLLARFNGRAIKSVMVELSAVAAKIQRDTDPEKIIAQEGAAQLRLLMKEQGVFMDKLEADLALFRKAFNERILYFRQLQEISDSVAEAEWEGDVTVAIQACIAERRDLEAKVNTNRARQRYLNHLAKNKEDGIADDDEDDTCILCKCEFNRGYITQCAHVFCEGCMRLWMNKKDSQFCPVCRTAIDIDRMQRFTVSDSAPAPEKPVMGEPAPKSRRQIQYNMIDRKIFQDIETVESHGSYGSKIQTLIRHLLYLQFTDPGAKSIVFSAWADSLHIIEHALVTNGIPFLRIDKNRGKESAAKKFRTDPDILVLLLHGERENAGLNVTCASRVFLVESVVHHGFEVQAIARIDRMGQTRPTEVYCYYAEGTVEKNILDLAARQGLSLYTKENAAGTLNVAAFANDSSKKTADSSIKKKVQKGDFIFNTDDMLAILFPHLFEDVEYLLPEDDAMEVDSGPSLQLLNSQSQGSIGGNGNARAGPSRLG